MGKMISESVKSFGYDEVVKIIQHLTDLFIIIKFLWPDPQSSKSHAAIFLRHKISSKETVVVWSATA